MEDKAISIRAMTEADAYAIADEEIKQGWHTSADKYLMRLRDQREGLCIALVADYEGHVAGYIHVYLRGDRPKIVDFGVLEKDRRHGVGSRLMDAAEDICRTYSDTAYLSVGLHSGYGSAQRLYAQRGYIPDGSGVWYQDKVCEPYTPCVNDDDLVINLQKKLR